MNEETNTITIPTEMYRQIVDKIKGTDIASVEDYVKNILQKSLEDTQPKEQELSEEDEEKVKERLKALGYMD
jgi:Arc/MetJ-type ribon-helix-helix transcriptional regulator